MNTLSGASKVRTLIVSSGAISVSMSMTGIPASIILLTGAVSVPMPNAWMATKSHFCEAMLSIAARCLTASSWPSNQVTSTLNSLPQYSAACLPCAHQVACNPALENAALSGFSDRPAASANAADINGLTPNPPNRAAAPAPATAAFISLRRSSEISFVSVITSSLRPGVPRRRRVAADHGIERYCDSIPERAREMCALRLSVRNAARA